MIYEESIVPAVCGGILSRDYGDQKQRDNSIIKECKDQENKMSLEIDYNRYNYQHGDLSPAIMLAIAGHLSLTKLKWRFPSGHESDEFCKCMLSVCQMASIRELVADLKEFIQPYCGMCGGECFLARWGCHDFSYEDVDGHHEMNSNYQELRKRLDLPMDQLGPHLQQLYIPQVSCDQFEGILNSLAASSLQTLEVLGLSTTIAAEDLILVLSIFPNLREIDIDSVKIYVRDTEAPSQILQSIKDLGSDKVIVQDWDPSHVYRADETISEWWEYWTKVQLFMTSVVSAHAQQSNQSAPRRIHMRFMYPIRAFMLESAAKDYANGQSLWAGGRRTLTVEDARMVMKDQEEELAARSAHLAAKYAPSIVQPQVAPETS
ncbi:hypothetical protein BGZ81_010850 [Podila clonocystis]|nr:hypothetical protein BGZ81_010850 [Podila clonocystis]